MRREWRRELKRATVTVELAGQLGVGPRGLGSSWSGGTFMKALREIGSRGTRVEVSGWMRLCV